MKLAFPQAWVALICIFQGVIIVAPTNADPIPARNGTDTRVQLRGRQFDIDGGQLSGDRANLFHDFERFNLSRDQIANFLSNPEIRNILTRVSGGEASLINGLLQISGGNSNLYLMNPSGIVFGPSAQLNLPADFTATTANGIAFGSNWFNAIGLNDYANLTGSPTGFAFTMGQPGLIFNAGDLELNPEQQLTLLGGTVTSTGRLSAPNGQITVTAVAGGDRLRIRQAGHVLQLEIENPVATGSPTPWTLPITSLPELLAGGNRDLMTGVSSNASGEIQLTGTTIPIAPGDVTVREINAQTATLTATNNLISVEGQLSTTGDLTLQARDTVRLRDSQLVPLSVQSGGNLLIQGDRSIDILALNHPGTPFQSAGNLTLRSDGAVSADSHFASGGQFSILNLSNQPGNFISLYDPIISSTGDVTFGNYTGVALKIETLGSITGGNITITGPDTMLTGSDPDIPILTSNRALILRAGLSSLVNSPNVPQTIGGTTFTPNATTSNLSSITIGNVTTSASTSSGGPLILNAPGNITVGNIDSRAGSGSGATFSVSYENRTLRTSRSGGTTGGTGDGGSISITSQSGSITVGSLSSFATTSVGNGGNIQVSAAQNITLGTVNATATGQGNGGSVRLRSSSGSITTGDVLTLVPFGSGNGGSVVVNAATTVQTGDISTFAESGDAGSVRVLASSDITTGNISGNTSSTSFPNSSIAETGNAGDGGDIFIRSTSGSVTTDVLITESSGSDSDGIAGDISVSASSNISIDSIFNRGSDGFGSISLSAANVDEGEVNFGFGADSNLLSIIEGSEFNSRIGSSPQQQTPQQLDPSELPEDVASLTPARSAETSEETVRIEASRQREFEDVIARGFEREFATARDIRYTLTAIEQQTNTKSAVVYVFVEEDQIRLRVETEQRVVETSVSESRDSLLKAVEQFYKDTQNPDSDPRSDTARYLYRVLIKPIEDKLEELGEGTIDTFLFSMDSRLRPVPLAALYDEESGKFFVEKYSFSIIPNFTSTDIRYTQTNDFQVLAMGMSEILEDMQTSPLPGVPLELYLIAESRGDELFLDRGFIFSNLQQQRNERPFRIVHLATHTTFVSDNPGRSNIQLWDTSLLLDERLDSRLRNLNWDKPSIDLLVLSACETGIGDSEIDSEEWRLAGLGFAGLSLQAGVKSTLASLWRVNDLGTLVLMREFYRQLETAPTKAEALRRAQSSLVDPNQLSRSLTELQQEIEDLLRSDRPQFLSQFADLSSEEITALRRDLYELNALLVLDESRDRLSTELSHPSYWSAFTMIGSPW
ncbi:CHAT domain-containing protein [Oscillatoria sp. FACHB-1407]|uniref:CHAT domain-containing protein n=1 Tax=Oscillatoria sp. FACHB-1407 TaxID=2692847 RepID=UPI001684C26C|nr:CHAT domain-containing protein [Oscillatoria sp. FACHB-1407]MBD2461335.1 CHAT domain-containing protein [Oscillatoria sp. FACHB-1407]